MSLLLDLLWIVLGGGFLIGLEYALAGVLLCLTVVGIPFGLQCFKLARLGMFPFGKDIRTTEAGLPGGLLRLFMNILWIPVAGIWIFISHLSLACASAITIIGIPFAIQHLKFAVLALVPFGRRAEV
ncbi:MAG: YccF domain-containing protein [Myxococcota bacterium]